MTPIQKVSGIGPALAALLAAKGISTAEQLAKTSSETLQTIPRLGAQRAFALLAVAQEIVAGSEDEVTVAASATPIDGAESKGAGYAGSGNVLTLPVKTSKKSASEKAGKASAALEKAERKNMNKAKKANVEKTAKKVVAKKAKSTSEMKAKGEKAAKKKTAEAQKAKIGKVSKAKLDQAAKPKKKKKSK